MLSVPMPPVNAAAVRARYLTDLDGDNFVETNCRGRPGVSGAPLWVYVPPKPLVVQQQSAPAATPAAPGAPAAQPDAGGSSSNSSSGIPAASKDASNSSQGQAEQQRQQQRQQLQPRQGRRVVQAVLTAGVPGGPTAAVRIDAALAQWVAQRQQEMPCAD